MTTDAPRDGDWVPTPRQSRFLSTKADECLYGGAAGGGKSAGLVALPLRWVHIPKFRALVLRRQSTQLGDMLDKAFALYPRAFRGAKFNYTTNTCAFPSGAKIRFNHCEHEKDAAIYDGHEFQVVEFDELTHFTKKQYLAIRARLRSSTPGLPRYTRATTNPGGVGGDWVFARWGAWLDPDFKAKGLTARVSDAGEKVAPAAPGEVLWYVVEADAERYVPKGTPGARSRVFIPARLADNPHIGKNDPGYADLLRDLDPVRRAQLLDGDWLVRPAKGLYFKRAHFADRFVDVKPTVVTQRVRYWDRASTAGGGDWTVGVLMSRTPERTIFIEDIVRFQGDPGTVEATIKATAELDGKDVRVCLEQDPGQAGVAEMAYLIKSLQGFDARAYPKRVNKVVAAGPLSAQCAARNVWIVRGAWNEVFFLEVEDFPEGKKDDQVDGASGGFNALVSGAGPIVYDPQYDDDLPSLRV